MRFFDQGDGAGGDLPEAADANKPDPNAAPADKGDAGGKEPVKPTVESLTKELEEVKGKHADLATKLGAQSGNIGKLKVMADAIQNDPLAVIKGIAKKAGINLNLGNSQAPDLAKVLTDGSPEEQATAITAGQTASEKQVLDNMNAALDPLVEEGMKTKYNDWDDLGDSRDAVAVVHVSGKLPDRELYHLAARGAVMETALEKAVEHGKKARDAELAKKNQEQIDGSGTGGKPKAAESAMVLSDVLKELDSVR